MAMTDFFIHVDTLMDYEVQFDSEDASIRDETSYAIYKVEVQEVWDQIKALYRKALAEVEEIYSRFQCVFQHYEKNWERHQKAQFGC